jgi:Zn finger protein HypA/HybF involved in hydrogenase expression
MEDAMATCMICSTPSAAAANEDSSYVCQHCEAKHAHVLDDDDDRDGRAEARQLTILAIDIDE